jgi:hypothetical protein
LTKQQGQITPDTLAFEAAWRDLNRRSAVLWFLLFGCLPGIFLLGYLLNDLLQQDAPILAVGLAWMAGIAWAGGRMASFVCPRCGRAFFENWYFFKPLRGSCAYCNLPRRAKNLPPATSG